MANKIHIERKQYISRAIMFPIILLMMFMQWLCFDILQTAWNLTHDE